MKDLTSDELLKAIRQCLNEQKNELGYYPTYIHSDRGSNYMSKQIVDYLNEQNIITRYSTPENPQQNGLAEKTEQDLENIVRSLLLDENLPTKLWAEALNYATYLSNRLYHTSINTTPYEAYFKVKPNLSNLIKFGSKVYVHVPKHKRKHKLSPRTITMKFVGYTNSTVNFRVTNLNHTLVAEVTGVLFKQPQQIQKIQQTQPKSLNESKATELKNDFVQVPILEYESEIETINEENKESETTNEMIKSTNLK